MPSGHYVQTFTASVRDEDCDALGHMYVQHYFRAVSDGMFVMMERLGLSRDAIARRRISIAVVHAETDFVRELHAGEAIALESCIQQVGTRSSFSTIGCSSSRVEIWRGRRSTAASCSIWTKGARWCCRTTSGPRLRLIS